MKRYKIKIEPEAFVDIQTITAWYDDVSAGLGERFQKTVISHINSLNQNPQIYAIRYKQIRCALMKKFPYMVHFFINEENNTVEVLAIISTDRDPMIKFEKTIRHR